MDPGIECAGVEVRTSPDPRLGSASSDRSSGASSGAGGSGTTVDNPYSHLENISAQKRIGRGQFSVVYRARCLTDGAIVALKKVQVRDSCLR